MKEIKTVLVLGAGVMGHGIAQTFAMNRLNVFLVDKEDTILNRGLDWIRENLRDQGRLGLKSEKGFYDYEDGALETMKKKRDRRLYARLNIFNKENQGGSHV